MGPAVSGWGAAVTAHAGPSLVWIGLVWDGQSRAGLGQAVVKH